MDKYKYLINQLESIIKSLENKNSSYSKGKLKAYKDIFPVRIYPLYILYLVHI